MIGVETAHSVMDGNHTETKPRLKWDDAVKLLETEVR